LSEAALAMGDASLSETARGTRQKRPAEARRLMFNRQNTEAGREVKPDGCEENMTMPRR
jgi:hypothetical protein